MAGKKNELALVGEFRIATPYEGLSEEELAELKDQMEDLEDESGISCRMIKIPAGGKLAYEVQGDEEGEEEYLKEIDGVVIFTHRLNGYWPNAFGTSNNPEDKIPVCSSMDGKTGLNIQTGEITSCENCPMNQFGSAIDQKGMAAKGKACKNMRRLYMMMDGDPNFYLLTVPPTSIRDVNKQLAKIMAGGVPYTGLVVRLTLEKTQNAAGVAYSKVVIGKSGLLPPAVSAVAKEMRRQIKEQYQSMAITADDYTSAPEQGAGGITPPPDFQEAPADADGFMNVPEMTDEELPFN